MSQKTGKFFPLFICKARIFTVRFGIFQVNLLMCHIQVPAEHHWLFCIKGIQVAQHGIFPFHTVGKAGQLILGIRGIAGHQIKAFIFQGNNTAFLVVLLYANSIYGGQGRMPGKNSCS